jgi:hypothetical protein
VRCSIELPFDSEFAVHSPGRRRRGTNDERRTNIAPNYRIAVKNDFDFDDLKIGAQTNATWSIAVRNRDRPTIMALSRQVVPMILFCFCFLFLCLVFR